jgi:DNA-binding transcriptional ArsR family regulator
MARTDSPDAQIAKVLSHPLRPQILEMLALRGEASPNEIARELGVPLGTLSYHTRLLRDSGWIELVREVPRRGAVEHYYRAVVNAHVDRLPLELDETGWRELSELLSNALVEAGKIQERSNKRRTSRNKGSLRSSELAILHYARAR